MSNTTYNLSNMQNALVDSPFREIKMLPLKTIVSVRASEWQECLDLIHKLCSTKWDSKRCGCSAFLHIKQYVSSDVVTFCMSADYTNHVPGNKSDLRTLPLSSKAIKMIENLLKGGSNCRNTRISVLNRIEEWGLKNLLYMFHSDEDRSLAIWMNERLPSQNYCIFTAQLLSFNASLLPFAFGFQSPSQIALMTISKSVCIDATHGISARSMEVLYSIVTHHPETGKDMPITYMITNDHSATPIDQWLVHLYTNSGFTSTNIAIDCSIAEINAITAVLPQAAIHFCNFHVLCAWQQNHDSKVKLDASYTSEQLGKYKQDLKNDLKDILVESDEEMFLEKIDYFTERIQRTMELLRRWERLYIQPSHLQYLTNNYIEPWHNQLKTIYMNRACVRRLDRLVFILTDDIEFFYSEEVERIHINNGRMGPVENKLSWHSYAASQIQEDILPTMIISPSDEIRNSMDDSDGKWKIKSFISEDL
ncbi:hypothetical protein PHYBLDRAFT_169918 [Phycomyces blakesleeanus NRRL 1555(-)]|uniref:MULE transposase domain-containing protein n=1 Tax=Phycomyces blakesleeanus (strain ATCC 8743b / DSM 1359 / FGSC 10004 / NBRC 33097 / NRRL 1555) TaxID=763407 RepID=A0A167M780_PHYB8|nr:hypothetical protein PHYBLDRAFT_169918 [Phycomyces blakesleeanus NRRL 1555(-)]OAD72009.1 hypothetical protein PHYBLDRAFT_169918 [Phycomyces blakesleeanus NRRL 1555(-)]|eukprot:XP_018290049.1 hypothetical protein PHYBLDRAFT_169918 [Phycomyces blakesleeanus NRRL 1555(-)]